MKNEIENMIQATRIMRHLQTGIVNDGWTILKHAQEHLDRQIHKDCLICAKSVGWHLAIHEKFGSQK